MLCPLLTDLTNRTGSRRCRTQKHSTTRMRSLSSGPASGAAVGGDGGFSCCCCKWLLVKKISEHPNATLAPLVCAGKCKGTFCCSCCCCNCCCCCKWLLQSNEHSEATLQLKSYCKCLKRELCCCRWLLTRKLTNTRVRHSQD